MSPNLKSEKLSPAPSSWMAGLQAGGWTKAAAGMFTPDKLMPGAARSVSARTAARLGIPASEL